MLRHILAHPLLVALLLAPGCGSDGNGEKSVWSSESIAIDYTLRGVFGQTVCSFSATREQLSEDQLDGLDSLALHDATPLAACDVPSYAIVVRDKSGSSAQYLATSPECAAKPILLFQDFDGWASDTPCSSASQNR